PRLRKTPYNRRSVHPQAWRRYVRGRRMRRPRFAALTPADLYKLLSIMWFKNLKVFRLAPSWSVSLDALETALEKLAYRPGNSLEMQTLGWVPPFEGSGLAYSVQGHVFLSLRAEKKLLPSTVINQVTRAKALEIEEQQGFKPGRRQLKELKEQVTD